MNSKRQISWGAVLSYVNIGVGALVTLLYTPFIIRILGQSEYGLYNTVYSVISSLSILSLGFGSSYVRFFTRYKNISDEKSIEKLNGMFMTIFVLIGLVGLGCGIFLSNNLQLVFADGLTERELALAKQLMILLTINLTLSFPCSVFTSIITAHERFIFQKILQCVRQVASPLICIPLLLMGTGALGMVISMVIVYLMVDIGNALYCIIRLKVKFNFAHFDWKLFREVGVYSLFIAINMIVDQINLNVDKILLGRFRGTVSVAVYSAGFTLYNYVVTFSTSISNVFTPRIHQIWNRNEESIEQRDQEMSHVFANVGKYQLIIMVLIMSGLVLFGRQFIQFWAGDGYENAYWIILLLGIPAIVPLTQNVGIEIQRAKNKHYIRSILYLAMAIINLILSIYLCQVYGEIGSAIGTSISFIVANGVLMNWVYKKYIGINIREYWKNFFRVIAAMIIPLCIGILFCNFVDTFKIPFLLLGIVIYAICYLIAVWFIVFNSEERSRMLQTVLKSLHIKSKDVKK